MQAITAVPTSIALFVDPAATSTPRRITSARDFASPSIELFYANGGGAAYVSSDLRALDDLPDVALLVMPGVTEAKILDEALAMCEQSDRCFLIADRPDDPVRKSSYGAIYGPALLVDGAKVPASGAVAGIYARIDRTRGVWRAPAGSEATVEGIAGPAETIAQSNDFNVIRTFTGLGTVVWGARTIDRDSDEWKYVPVRRFALMVSESIRCALQSVVFEPNDASTWTAVRETVANFLDDFWRQGALAGMKPEDAYHVEIGAGSTMTADDIANGRLNVNVMFAPLQPAEFVVLRFTQAMEAT